MKKGKKVVAVLLSMTMALASLTGCGGKGGSTPTKTDAPAVTTPPLSSLNIQPPAKVEKKADVKKVSLTVWCPAEEKAIMEEMCKIFNDSYAEAEITFKTELVQEGEAAQRLAGDPQNSADVFMFAGDSLPSLVESSYIYDISQLEKDHPDMKAQYDEQAYASGVIDSKLYALPFTANQFFLYYNKSMYTEEEVKSLDTMMAKDFPDLKDGTKVKNFATSMGNGWYIGSFFYAGGCTLFGDGTDPTKCDWNSANGVEVVKYLNKMVAEGKVHNDSSDDSLTLLEKGTLASWTSGSWKSNEAKKKLGDNYAATTLPSITINGKAAPLAPFADYKCLGVNAATEYTQEAANLAYFLAGDFAQNYRLQARAFAPTLKKLQESLLVDAKVDPAVVAATLQMQPTNSVARPTTTQLSKYWNAAGGLGDLIFKQDPKVADEKNVQSTLDLVTKAILAK